MIRNGLYPVTEKLFQENLEVTNREKNRKLLQKDKKLLKQREKLIRTHL